MNNLRTPTGGKYGKTRYFGENVTDKTKQLLELAKLGRLNTLDLVI